MRTVGAYLSNACLYCVQNLRICIEPTSLTRIERNHSLSLCLRCCVDGFWLICCAHLFLWMQLGRGEKRVQLEKSQLGNTWWERHMYAGVLTRACWKRAARMCVTSANLEMIFFIVFVLNKALVTENEVPYFQTSISVVLVAVLAGTLSKSAGCSQTCCTQSDFVHGSVHALSRAWQAQFQSFSHTSRLPTVQS